MEQARMATTQSMTSASAARGKSVLSGKPEGQSGAGGTDFLALLGFLADEGVEAGSSIDRLSVQEAASASESKKLTLDLGPGLDQMPWLLPANTALSPFSLIEPASDVTTQERGTVGLSSSVLPLGGTQPDVAQALGAVVLPPTPVLGNDPVQSLRLGGAPGLSQEGLLFSGKPLEATAEIPLASPLAADPANYPSTLDRVQEGGAAAWRGKGGAIRTSKGERLGISWAEVPMTVSTTVTSRVAERTVDLAQWSLRDPKSAAGLRPDSGVESEGLLSFGDRERDVLPATAAGTDANDTGAQSGGGAEGGTAKESFNVSGSLESDVFQGEALGLSAEERVADQVSQWVGKTIHNAELTVDRDGQAVHVTVTMSGQEAQVTFRTDEGQTRALLDAHLSELGEMLRNQGLALSGAWVGTSQQQSRRDDSGAPQSTAALGRPSSGGPADASESLSVNRMLPRSVPSQRTLDIFV